MPYTFSPGLSGRVRFCIILTNDNDFALLADETERAGVVIYNDQDLRTRETPSGVVRIDNAYDTLENQLEWLEGWI